MLPASLRSAAAVEFDTLATLACLVIAATIAMACAGKRQWPELGPLLSTLVGVTGFLAATRIITLTLATPPGAACHLAGDRNALIVGCIGTLFLSAQEAVKQWRKATGI